MFLESEQIKLLIAALETAADTWITHGVNTMQMPRLSEAYLSHARATLALKLTIEKDRRPDVAILGIHHAEYDQCVNAAEFELVQRIGAHPDYRRALESAVSSFPVAGGQPGTASAATPA